MKEPAQPEFQSGTRTPKDLSDALLMAVLSMPLSQHSFNSLFEELFDRYRDRVTRWCYRVTKNKERANDLTQEVFLRAFRSLHTFRGDAQLSTWLYVITRNHCLNALKKWKNEPDDQGVNSSLYLVAANDDDVQVTLERGQSYQRLLHFLNSILTPTEVRIMILHFVQGLTIPEITRQLKLLNRSGAKAYIVNARRKLNIATHGHIPAERLKQWAGQFYESRRKRAA